MQALNGDFSVFFADFGLPGQPGEMDFTLRRIAPILEKTLKFGRG